MPGKGICEKKIKAGSGLEFLTDLIGDYLDLKVYVIAVNAKIHHERPIRQANRARTQGKVALTDKFS